MMQMQADPYMGGGGGSSGSGGVGAEGMEFETALDPNLAYEASGINPDELNQYLNIQ